MEKWFELLSRLVIAVEKLADKPCDCKGEPYPCPAPVFTVETTTVEHPVEQELAEADAAHMEREALKIQLRTAGVKFKESARTETLQKLLDEFEAKQRESFGRIEANDPPATADDVRKALVDLSAAKGREVAVALLQEVGGAEKLPNVDPARYGAIVKAAQEACHGG